MFDVTARAACADSLPSASAYSRFDAVLRLEGSVPPRELEPARARVDSAYRDFVARGECRQFLDLELAATRTRMTAVRDSAMRRATIKSIADVPWYSELATVMAKLGAPDAEQDKAGVVRELVYFKRDLLGHSATLQLTLDRRVGLVEGIYIVPLAVRDDCDDIYRRLREAVRARYPTLVPEVDRRENESVSLDICGAIRIGKGRLGTIWRDASDNEIALIVSDNSIALRSRTPSAKRAESYLRFVAAQKSF